MEQIAQWFGISVQLTREIYWWGVIVVSVIVAIVLLVNHYRQYYQQLKDFIAKDGAGHYVPNGEIGHAELFTGALLIGATGFCWPVGVLGLVIAGVAVATMRACKFIVNLPRQIVQRKLVKTYKAKMLTSPSQYIRYMAESHHKKGRMLDEEDSE